MKETPTTNQANTELIKKAHRYLMDRGCKSMGEQYPAIVVQQMLAEFAEQQINKPKTTLQDKIELKIYDRISLTSKKVELIVMHPQTWVNLVEEIYANANLWKDDNTLHYRGIKVLRSLDLKEGTIEVV